MTSFVEGFGDEVVQCLCALFIVSLSVFLWRSTYVPERHLFGGAFIMFEQRRRQRALNARPVRYRGLPFPPSDSSDDSESDTPPQRNGVQTNSTLNNDNPENKNENTASSENDVTETESTTQSNESSQSTNDAINNPQTYEDTIKIRLKYLNDNCRLVEGRLQENVGVFKRRHFSSELSSNKIIKLIFQGKMMNNDKASLRSFGLHDNCVVHCLVHHPRSSENAQQNPNPVIHDTTQQAVPNPTHHGQRQPEPVQPQWSLATFAFVAIAIILLILWYLKYKYSSFFSCTSTCTLVILTIIYLFNAFITFLIHSENQQPRRGSQIPR